MPVERYPLTPEHIAQGLTGDGRFCPVGLCLTPALGDLFVRRSRILYPDDDGFASPLYYRPRLDEIIRRFDTGDGMRHGMRPGTIIINREECWADYEPEETP
jgi:hypothetical protein